MGKHHDLRHIHGCRLSCCHCTGSRYSTRQRVLQKKLIPGFNALSVLQDVDAQSHHPIKSSHLTANHSGRLAQRESTAFTRQGSLVQSQYRPPNSITRRLTRNCFLLWSNRGHKKNAKKTTMLKLIHQAGHQESQARSTLER